MNMKSNKFYFIFLISIFFSSCNKYLITGTNNHSLNDEIEFDSFNENIIGYDSNYIEYRYPDTIGNYDSGYYYTDTTKIYYRVDGNVKKISKIECLKKNEKNADEIIKYFKKSHNLISKSEITYKYRNHNYYNSKKYIFGDQYTENELVVIKFDDNLCISYITPEYEEDTNEKNVDFTKFSTITGTEGFVLGMRKKIALENLTKQNFYVITNNSYSSYKYDGINRYFASHTGKKYEHLYIDPYFDEMENAYEVDYFNRDSYKRITLDFIEDLTGQQILTAYYTTDYWINEKDNSTQRSAVFSDFIDPLTKKYHLKNVSARKYEPNDAEYTYTYIFDDLNKNNLQITLFYRNVAFTKIRIEYSLDDELIASYQKRLDDAKNDKVNSGNNSIVDKL